MDFLQTILNLTEADRQKITETLMILKNAGANIVSNDSSSKSGTDLKDLSSDIPEKPPSKQKTLDNWLVKTKTPSSKAEKKVTNSKETVSISETGESSRNCDSEEVSSIFQNHHLPRSASTLLEKPTMSENVINNNLKLGVLLNKQDCIESKLKSPEHNKFSFEKTSISPIKIKSLSKKQDHVSENCDLQILSSECHSPIPVYSYNLRSAKGVAVEKGSGETSNFISTISECIETDKIPTTIHKQKSKVKNCLVKDASPNSNNSVDEVEHDQEIESCSDRNSEEIIKNLECKASSLDTQRKNSHFNFRKCSSNKKLALSKQNVASDSNKEESDDLNTKLEDNGFAVPGSKDQFLENLDSYNTSAKYQKEKAKTKIIVKKNQSNKKNTSKSRIVGNISLSKNDEIKKFTDVSIGENSMENSFNEGANKKTSINKVRSIKKTELDSSSEKGLEYSPENEHLLENSLEVPMDLDSPHSFAEISDFCENSTNPENIIDLEKSQAMISDTAMDVLLNNNSKGGKEENIIVRDIEGNTEKIDDIDIALTNFESSVEFDEKMKSNYESLCKVKEVLEAIEISIEELFENPELVNHLKSVPPDDVYIISKCKSDSNISVYVHESKKELRKILNKLKKEYNDKNK